MRRRDLGRTTGRLLRWLAGVGETYNDAAAFHAPSECYPLIDRGLGRSARKLLREEGILNAAGFDAFLAEVTRRTNARWVYESSLAHIGSYAYGEEG
jgi:hypothetical protein